VPVARLFEGLRLVIIDELHALAGTDRGAHLMSVLERLAESVRARRRTVLATGQ
jgi:ATP-dependent Lhr-like helicase